MVTFQRRNNSAEHHCALCLGRFLYLHNLKTACQRGIFLKIFLVFGPCRRSDRTQLTTRERRLEDIGGIVLSGLSARSDHRMRFIDEQDDRLRRSFHFFNKYFQPIFEFTLDAGTRLQ